jgi:hypothetical protein
MDEVSSRCSATGSVLGDGRPANCTNQSGRSSYTLLPAAIETRPRTPEECGKGHSSTCLAEVAMKPGRRKAEYLPAMVHVPGYLVDIILSLTTSTGNTHVSQELILFLLLPFLFHLVSPRASSSFCMAFFFLMQKPTPASMSWLRHGWRPTIAADNESNWTMLLAYGSMVAGA